MGAARSQPCDYRSDASLQRSRDALVTDELTAKLAVGVVHRVHVDVDLLGVQQESQGIATDCRRDRCREIQ